MFTVSLPKYNYTHTYELKKFTESFPDCLITLALQSEEKDIPLTHPLATPALLQLLSWLMTNKNQYISQSSLIPSLKYLGIKLPDILFHPKYLKLLSYFSYI